MGDLVGANAKWGTFAADRPPRAVPRLPLASLLVASLGCSVSEATPPNRPPVEEDPRSRPFEQLAASIESIERIASAEQLACRDTEGEPAMPSELPRGHSLPARAMWLPNIGHSLGGLPVLVLEEGAGASQAPRLGLRRTPGELSRLFPYRYLAIRACSDAVFEGHGEPQLIELRAVVTGLVDPLGRLVHVGAEASAPEDLMQIEFAACIAEAMVPDWGGSWLFRRTPRYTHFEAPIRFTGRSDLDRSSAHGCRGTMSTGALDVGGIAECRADEVTARVDELRLDEPLASFVGRDRWNVDVETARVSPEPREHTLALMDRIERELPRLAACRPLEVEHAVTNATLLIDDDARVREVWDANDCLRQVLTGLELPLSPSRSRGGVELISLIVVWSAPGLGPTPEELVQLRQETGYPSHELPEPVASLLGSPEARRLCPPELGLVQREIANGFGRVGESGEFALRELALALLASDPSQARACIEASVPALLPVLTWPAPVDRPAEESIGLYEAAERVDDWLAIFVALEVDPAQRERLGCFLRRAQSELMGTLALRDEASLPSEDTCARLELGRD